MDLSVNYNLFHGDCKNRANHNQQYKSDDLELVTSQRL